MHRAPTGLCALLSCLWIPLLGITLFPGCGDDVATGGQDASVPRDAAHVVDAGAAPDFGHTAEQGTLHDAGVGGSLADLLSVATWAEMFPNGNPLYTRAALVAAAAYYPAFATTGTAAQRRQEVAAFLANIAHETTGGWPTAPGGAQAWGLYFIEEVGCESGACTGYCDASNQTYPCASGRTYHGRGPIQLSWNYNYGQVGTVLGLDLLNEPSLVTSDGIVAFRTALWFWMTAQAPKPSAHDVMTGGWTPSAGDLAGERRPGFGMTINIINGGLECQQPTNSKVEDRVAFFQRFTSMLQTTTGADLYCDQMQHY